MMVTQKVNDVPRLIMGMCFSRLDSNLPDEHPDSWLLIRRFRDEVALTTSVYTCRGIIGGREVLLFVDSLGRRWAQYLISRSWIDLAVIDAPSNRDLAQELAHKNTNKGKNDE